MNPLSGLFGAAVSLRNRLYDSGHFQQQKLASPVISIGNISVGGTGKTPFTIALAELLRKRGYEIDVLSRGYGRRSKGTVRVTATTTPEEGGDEPVLMARRLGVPVYVSGLRRDAGKLAETESTNRIHLLDDGLQHRQLARDFNIALLAERDLKDCLLPIGRLREPLSALSRADAVVVNEDLTEGISGFSGPVWKIRRSLALPPNMPKRLVAFCAIAKPAAFFDQLRATGLELADTISFADHHHYTTTDLERLRKVASESRADGFITTEKDAVKIDESELRDITVAPLVTELLDADANIDFLTSQLRERCPDWYQRRTKQSDTRS